MSYWDFGILDWTNSRPLKLRANISFVGTEPISSFSKLRRLWYSSRSFTSSTSFENTIESYSAFTQSRESLIIELNSKFPFHALSNVYYKLLRDLFHSPITDLDPYFNFFFTILHCSVMKKLDLWVSSGLKSLGSFVIKDFKFGTIGVYWNNVESCFSDQLVCKWEFS